MTLEDKVDLLLRAVRMLLDNDGSYHDTAEVEKVVKQIDEALGEEPK